MKDRTSAEASNGDKMGRGYSGVPALIGVVAIAWTALAGVGQAQTAKPAAPAPAKPPPVSADPASTSASYGDWVMRCQRVGEGDKAQRVCEVAQTVQVQGQQQPIAQIAFGRLATADPMKLTIALPPNISLPGSVTVALNDKDPSPMSLTWRRCLPGACIADIAPTADTIKSFRAAIDPGRLAFKEASGRDVALPFSFRGLAQALDALAKE